MDHEEKIAVLLSQADHSLYGYALPQSADSDRFDTHRRDGNRTTARRRTV